MPPLPPVANVVKVRLIGVNQGAPWNVILHASYQNPPPTSAQLQTYGVAVVNAFNSNIAALCNTAVELTTVEVTDLGSVTGQQGVAGSAAFGTRAGTTLPVSVALVSSWHINLRYRGGHPRSYWPGGVESDVVSGRTWSVAFQAEAHNGFNGFLTTMNGTPIGAGSSGLVVVSYHTNHQLRPIPLVSGIIAVTVHPRLDTQRRRLGKEFA